MTFCYQSELSVLPHLSTPRRDTKARVTRRSYRHLLFLTRCRLLTRYCFVSPHGSICIHMRPFLEKQLLRTLKLWDQRDSGLWRANPRHLLSSVLSSTQGTRLSKHEKLELNETLQMLVRYKRRLDFWVDRDSSGVDDGCQWSRRLKVLQSSTWKQLQNLDCTAQSESVEPAPVLVSFPERLYDKISTHLGPRLCQEFCHISNEIPTWAFLRCNPAAGSMNSLVSSLTKLGHRADICQEAGNCIKVESASSVSAVPLSQLPLYLSGELEIQDESSQLVAQLVKCRPTDTVIDLCSGAGGKALAILPHLQSTGCLVLHDPRASSLKRAKQRVLRAQSTTASKASSPRVHFATNMSQVPKDRAHWVLIDAPCSNTGSLRRHPECKYRWWEEEPDYDSFLHLKEVQRYLLGCANDVLCQGGMMVYSTCSILPEENEQQIQWAEQHLGLTVCTAECFLPRQLSRDGYFAAVLKKRAHPCTPSMECECTHLKTRFCYFLVSLRIPWAKGRRVTEGVSVCSEFAKSFGGNAFLCRCIKISCFFSSHRRKTDLSLAQCWGSPGLEQLQRVSGITTRTWLQDWLSWQHLRTYTVLTICEIYLQTERFLSKCTKLFSVIQTWPSICKGPKGPWNYQTSRLMDHGCTWYTVYICFLRYT